MTKECKRITMNYMYNRIEYIGKILYDSNLKAIYYRYFEPRYGFTDSMSTDHIRPNNAQPIIDLVNSLIGEGYPIDR